MQFNQIIKKLRSLADAKNVEGMARFGISAKNTLGVSMPVLKSTAKSIGKDHELALQLWGSGIHEARILAGLIDDPEFVTDKQMDQWVNDFDSWDICDQTCMNLFWKMPCNYKRSKQWIKNKKEFVKRAGFAMMAVLAVHDKKAKDPSFLKLLPLIKKGSTDERNFVKKAVNWALRQIGKRNKRLRKNAIVTAKQILKIDSKAAKWIASDAIRELSNHNRS